jgi:hypothetical protein
LTKWSKSHNNIPDIPTSRFDQHRHDEFGFLAKFINQILDDLDVQHQN